MLVLVIVIVLVPLLMLWMCVCAFGSCGVGHGVEGGRKVGFEGGFCVRFIAHAYIYALLHAD